MKAFNGIIEHASLFDDGVAIRLTLSLKLCNGFGVTFGHYLYNENCKTDESLGNYAGWYICNVLKIANSYDLERIKGKPIRAIFEKDGHNDDICIGIQNFMDYTKYLIPNETKYTKEELEKLTDPWEE